MMMKLQKIFRIKRTKPAPSLTGEPMPSHESFRQVTALILRQGIPEFDPGRLSHILLLELEKGGRAMPKASYDAIFRVAACLKKQHFDEVHSDGLAREAVRKAMEARLDGRSDA